MQKVNPAFLFRCFLKKVMKKAKKYTIFRSLKFAV